MTTSTQIIPQASQAAHWYSVEGEPKHFIPKKDGSGNRPTTLRDARPNGWVPSVTSILQLLSKPQLERWKQGMACLAVLTAPRKEGEDLDAFIERVLTTERQQDEVSQVARDRGTEIHAGFEAYFGGQPVPKEIDPWIRPAIDALIAFGELASSESVIIGQGYGGRADLVQKCDGCFRIWDIKSTKAVPDPAKGSYLEHRLQCAAYAKAWSDKLAKAGSPSEIIVGNVYVSTTKQGEYVIIEHEDWQTTFEKGFRPLLVHWMWANNYWPIQPSPLAMPAPLDVAPVPPVEVMIDAPALIEHLKNPDFRARAAAAGWDVKELKAAAEKATAEPQAAPVPGAMPTNTNLPTHDKEGRKLSWTVATAQAPATPRK